MIVDFTRAIDTPDVKLVVKPKIIRSQTGKTVEVKAWDPRRSGKKT